MQATGILLMGGTGERFGSTLPKQFVRLSGKEVFEHTLHAFESSKLFDEIILTCPEPWIEHVRRLVSPKIRVIVGGNTRQESSLRALEASSHEIIVIHDAVRPFVTKAILQANIQAAKNHGAVDTCIPTTDTIVVGTKTISAIPDRSTIFRGQTPQSFKRALLLQAHMETKKQNATDDCQLVHDLGYPVHIVQGSEKNIKITTELDLIIAEQIIRTTTEETPQVTPQIRGKRYVITGGSGGLGTALATLLHKCGAETINFSRSSKSHPVDLTDYDATKQAFQKLDVPIDGIINCIGKFDHIPFSQYSQKTIDKAISSNLSSIIYSCLNANITPGGHIINVASSSYSRGRKGFLLYTASKAAVVNFTQGLAEELPHLYINTVIPPRLDTKMRHDAFPDEERETLLDPERVAEEIVSILSSNTTGILYEIKHTSAV